MIDDLEYVYKFNYGYLTYVNLCFCKEIGFNQ